MTYTVIRNVCLHSRPCTHMKPIGVAPQPAECTQALCTAVLTREPCQVAAPGVKVAAYLAGCHLLSHHLIDVASQRVLVRTSRHEAADAACRKSSRTSSEQS
jgi:hypothetical protein